MFLCMSKEPPPAHLHLLRLPSSPDREKPRPRYVQRHACELLHHRPASQSECASLFMEKVTYQATPRRQPRRHTARAWRLSIRLLHAHALSLRLALSRCGAHGRRLPISLQLSFVLQLRNKEIKRLMLHIELKVVLNDSMRMQEATVIACTHQLAINCIHKTLTLQIASAVCPI